MAFKTKFNPNKTPQSKPIPGKTMVLNRAGGYVFEIDKWEALRRFLIIGTMGGTYYASEREMTGEAYEALSQCLKEDGIRTVWLIDSVSTEGLALKNDYALYALAVATLPSVASEDVRRLAFAKLPAIARTGTHLFQFVQFRRSLGGTENQMTMKALRGWFAQPLDRVAYQVVKYQQRDGMSMRDLMRLVHPQGRSDLMENKDLSLKGHAALIRWIVDGITGREELQTKSFGKREAREAVALDSLPGIVQGFEHAKTCNDENTLIKLVQTYNLTREMIPTEYLNRPAVQEALLDKMPLHAMIRNLGNMSKSGLLTPTSAATARVIAKLSDAQWLQKSRVHPFFVLVALRTYASGRGRERKGRTTVGSWTVVPRIIDALDDAMYGCVANVPTTGKPVVVGIDGSGSMAAIVEDVGMSVRDAAVAMALFTVKAEPGAIVVGFTTRGRQIEFSPKQRVDDAIAMFNRHVVPEGTDGAIPMLLAANRWKDVAGFAVYTDNESWAGSEHPIQALNAYRRWSGVDSRFVSAAMTATRHSIADTKDPRSLNVVGFSADAAKVIGDFLAVE